MQCVYRFVDLKDNLVKYIGIVFGENRSLKQRTYEHIRYDRWCNNAAWRVDYIDVNNRAEAEALESHFISEFNTGSFFNKSKNDWGTNSFLSGLSFQWKEYCKVYGKEILYYSDESNEYQLKFIRVGLSVGYNTSAEFKENIVFGKYDNCGRICMSDGSVIDSDSVGMIYSNCQRMLQFYNGDITKIIIKKCRDRSFPHIDLITYCTEEHDIKQLKSLMLEISMSRYAQDCESSKLRYEQSYKCYQEYKKIFDSLTALSGAI